MPSWVLKFASVNEVQFSIQPGFCELLHQLETTCRSGLEPRRLEAGCILDESPAHPEAKTDDGSRTPSHLRFI